MSYQNPIYCYRHAARDVGTAGLSFLYDRDADYPEDNLIDNRNGSLMKFDAAQTGHYIQVDRGAGTPAAINKIVIPPGHNLDGYDIRVRVDTASDMSSATTVIPAVDPGSGLIDGDFSISSSHRYVRVDWPTDNFAPELGQLWLTKTMETDRGPEQRWPDGPTFNMIIDKKRSGVEAIVETGPTQREIEYRYRAVKLAADQAILTGLIDYCGQGTPFILYPAFDDEALLFMRLTRIGGGNDSPAPRVTDSRSLYYELLMQEWLA